MFVCKGEGFGRLHFKWQRQRGNISSSAVVDINNGMLTIPDLLSSDKGNYRCIICDEWNSTVYSEYIQLNVSESKSTTQLSGTHFLKNIYWWSGDGLKQELFLFGFSFINIQG